MTTGKSDARLRDEILAMTWSMSTGRGSHRGRYRRMVSIEPLYSDGSGRDLAPDDPGAYFAGLAAYGFHGRVFVGHRYGRRVSERAALELLHAAGVRRLRRVAAALAYAERFR